MTSTPTRATPVDIVTDCGERAAVAAPAKAATTDAQIDGYKLRRVPVTGINVDHVPGPPPVVFPDLVLRQSGWPRR